MAADGPSEERDVVGRAAADDGFRRELEEWRAAAIAAEMATGKREETVEEAKRHILVRVARMSLGAALVLLGIAMLVLPGPGFLCMAAGLAILAKDLPFADRWLQKVRKRLPEGEDGQLSKGFLAVSIGVAVVLVGVSSWVSWMKFTNDNWDIPLIPII